MKTLEIIVYISVAIAVASLAALCLYMTIWLIKEVIEGWWDGVGWRLIGLKARTITGEYETVCTIPKRVRSSQYSWEYAYPGDIIVTHTDGTRTVKRH